VLRRALLAASASEQIRRIVTTAPLTRGVVARFVAGDSADDALAVTRRLLDDGLLVSLDYLGEDTADPEQAAAVTDEYVRLLGRLDAGGMSGRGAAEVSVKPTAVGLDLAEHGEKTARENITRICAAASAAGTTVTLDAEDHTRIEATLRIAAQVRPDFPDLGCVIQSYQRGRRRRLPGARRGRPVLRPLPAVAHGRAGIPDDRHSRSAADPHRRAAGQGGRPAPGQLRVPDAVRHPPGRAAPAGP
jgi:hypothetical protein